MLKKIIVLYVLIVLQLTFVFAQTQENEDLAIKKYALSEFRDVSVWKGRKGLTLFSPDGKYLAVSGKSADVVIYDTETGEIKTKIDGTGFKAFSFSPDSKLAVAQSAFDSSMKIYEVESGKIIREIRGLGKLSNFNKLLGGSGVINSANGIASGILSEMGQVPFSKDWKNILVNKNDKEFALYDFETGNLKFEIAHENYNTSWETTKTVFVLLGMANGTPLNFILGSASNTQFSRDGKLLLITNGNKRPTLWNVETGKLVSTLESNEGIFSGQLSPDGRLVATSGFRGITQIWDAETGKLISSIGSKKDPGIAAGWTEDGNKILIVPTRKGDLKVFEAESGKPLYSFENSLSGGVFFGNTQKILVTLPRKDKTVLFKIWETETGKLLAAVPRGKKQPSIFTVRFSPNDEYILSVAGLKNNVEMWNTKGERLQTLKNSTFPMQFSSDGKYLATGGKIENSEVDTGYLWEIKREN